MKKHRKNKAKLNKVTSTIRNEITAVPTSTVVTTKTTSYTSKYYTPQTYVYKGTKNQTAFPEFVELCKYTQKELKDLLPKRLIEAGYTDIVVGDGYIYAKGSFPVLLTAHMDTVHTETVRDFYEYVDEEGNHIISSPQGIGGDDRCGIYMILDIIKEHKCSVLFCEDEESGGIGSKKFCHTEFINELADLKYLIELDRANADDAVFYDCDNPEFTKFIVDNTGYKEAIGSFSDISNLAPYSGVAAVNFSCGYYKAHRLGEEVNVEEMLNTIKVVKKLLSVDCEQFEYIESKWSGYYGYGYGYGYSGYSKYSGYSGHGYSGYGYGKTSNSSVNSTGSKYSNYYDDDDDYESVLLYVTFYDGITYEEKTATYYGLTEASAWVKFFKENPNTPWNLVLDYEFDYI